ncbi:hypothetical protein ACH61_02939 [Rathayibacter tanaceti]|uniref:Uncharacterized protein n=1 Tax=Rathayibacter tanaceti TaxID=1671680 RepID=A0A162GMJ8_9MICO|nr:hypothetical protein ACH61_02939 [Rathayibacter tanaceti]
MQLLAQSPDLGLGLDDGRLSELVALVERAVRSAPGLADLVLESVQCLSGGVPALPGGVQGVLRTEDLAADRRESRCRRVRLPAEARELEVVARDPCRLGGDLVVRGVEGGSGGDGRALSIDPAGLGVEDGLPQPLQLDSRLLDLLRGDPRLDLRLVSLDLEHCEALPRERREVAQPLLHRFQLEGGAPRVVDGVTDRLRLEPREAQGDLLEPLLEQDALAVPLALGARESVERRAQSHHVVGQEASTGVADHGRDRLGLAGDLGLAPERLELAPDLAGEIGEAGEVGLHRLELAEGLLFAAAVLEDARRLLDEAAPLLRGRAQHRIELPLPDDHVHLATETGVAQELLNVEQPAAATVDRVLTASVAEQRAGDRHLGVLDREGPVGVVDREGDLRPAERTAGGGAREDDILHLAAAERLGALLPHHPGQRVDDVALARAVGPDDAGDARLEGERGRLSEGLEPLEGQALQVHPAASLPSTTLPR